MIDREDLERFVKILVNKLVAPLLLEEANNFKEYNEHYEFLGKKNYRLLTDEEFEFAKRMIKKVKEDAD